MTLNDIKNYVIKVKIKDTLFWMQNKRKLCKIKKKQKETYMDPSLRDILSTSVRASLLKL